MTGYGGKKKSAIFFFLSFNLKFNNPILGWSGTREVIYSIIMPWQNYSGEIDS